MDAELASMTAISQLFEPLDRPAIGRVLAWASERWLGQATIQAERQKAEEAEAQAAARAQAERLRAQQEHERLKAEAKVTKIMKRRATIAAKELEDPFVRDALAAYYNFAAFPLLRRCKGFNETGDGGACGWWANRFDNGSRCLRHTTQPEVIASMTMGFESFLLERGTFEIIWRPSQALLILNWEKRIVPIPKELVDAVPEGYEPDVSIPS